MLSVSVVNQQEKVELDYPRIKEAARAVLAGEKVKKSKINLAFMTDEAIHKLNKRYLDHDCPTDVITFPYSGAKAAVLEGDIAISMETAQSAASERGHEVGEELLLYVIHGVLHLCGYDDLEEGDRREMREREKHYLGLLGVKVT